jgi:hypothetical protein
MSQFNLNPLYAGCSDCDTANMYSWIATSLPEYICRPCKITHQVNGTVMRVSLPAVMANLQAIKEAWVAARYHGTAKVRFCRESNRLLISLDYNLGSNDLSNHNDNHHLSLPLYRPKTYGVNSTSFIRNDDSFHHGFVMYGTKVPGRRVGDSIFTSTLDELICSYNSTLRHAAQKVAMSYGELVTLGGVNTDDVPLLEAIQDATMEKWERSRMLLATEGSSLTNITGNLQGIERLMRPFIDAITIESGVPDWLMFPVKVDSQYQLEEREIWATGLFQSQVLPILIGLLSEQGYDIIDIDTPNYRSKMYNYEIENKIADSLYKDSASYRNNTGADRAKMENKVRQSDIEDGIVKSNAIEALESKLLDNELKELSIEQQQLSNQITINPSNNGNVSGSDVNSSPSGSSGRSGGNNLSQTPKPEDGEEVLLSEKEELIKSIEDSGGEVDKSTAATLTQRRGRTL